MKTVTGSAWARPHDQRSGSALLRKRDIWARIADNLADLRKRMPQKSRAEKNDANMKKRYALLDLDDPVYK